MFGCARDWLAISLATLAACEPSASGDALSPSPPSVVAGVPAARPSEATRAAPTGDTAIVPPGSESAPAAPHAALETIRSVYPDGKPRLERQVKRDADGVINHGPYRRWHFNGQLAEEGEYVDGRKHGTYTVYAETGRKTSQVEYDRGRKHGPALEWNELGQGIRECAWRDDRLHGPFREWFEGTEELSVEGRYEDGLEVGRWVRWIAPGVKGEEGEYVAGLREGEWMFWHPTGAIRAEAEFRRGRWHGRVVEYDEQGRKVAERSYEDGAADGLQVELYPGGSIKSEVEYALGRPNGRMVYWYEEGSKQLEGRMRDGQREGRWTVWNNDGTVNEAWSGTYAAGQRVPD